MKKVSFIVSIAFLLTALLNSCKVEDNSLKQLNENGMKITSYWQAATQQTLMSTPNTVFHLNAWLSAPEEERPAIEDKYFTYSKIRPMSDQEWEIVLNGRTLCRIHTGGTLLSAPNAEWTVVDYDQSGRIRDMLPFGKDSVTITFRHIANKWSVETQGQEEASSVDYIPFYSFTIEPESGVIPADLSDCRSVVEGSGRYAFRTYRYVDNVQEPTEIHNYINFDLTAAATGNLHDWEDGLLVMRVYADMNAYEAGATNREQYDELIIRDRLSLRGGSQYAEITMHEVTETWPVARLESFDHWGCGNFLAALLELF